MQEIGKLNFNPDNNFISKGAAKAESVSSGSIIATDKAMKEAETMGTNIESPSSAAHTALMPQMKSIFLVKGVLHKAGATPLEPAAEKFSKKGLEIVGQAVNAISELSTQLKALSDDKSLTPEQKEAKVKLLEAKMKAIQDEASAKLAIVETLATSLPGFIGLVKDMQANGISTNILTEVFDKLMEGMSSKPSDLKGIENTEDLDKKVKENMQNLLGPNSADKTKELKKETDNKIKNAEEKLKDPDVSKEEKSQLKVEIKVYKAQKNIIQDIESKLSI